MILVCLISCVSLWADEVVIDDFGKWVFYNREEGIFLNVPEIRKLLTLLSSYEQDAQERDVYKQLWRDAATIAAEKERSISRMKKAIGWLSGTVGVVATTVIFVAVFGGD